MVTVSKKTTKRSQPKKVAKKDTVDYYPNRMTVAVSAAGGVLLTLLVLVAFYSAEG